MKDSGITVESSGMEGGVAKNNEALTVLDSPNYREQFLDELFEVVFSFCSLYLLQFSMVSCKQFMHFCT